jgi:hypothetical protein
LLEVWPIGNPTRLRLFMLRARLYLFRQNRIQISEEFAFGDYLHIFRCLCSPGIRQTAKASPLELLAVPDCLSQISDQQAAVRYLTHYGR